jgi:hypothetical protein
MKKTTLFALALALAVTPAVAQRAGELFGGDLGVHYSNDISAKFDQMTVQDIIDNPAYLEAVIPEDQLEAFFDNTVIKVSLYPDGTYAALSRAGGEVVGLQLGKKNIAVDGPLYDSGGWGLKAGEYMIPKRAQKLSLTFAARGSQATVECATPFSRSDQAITYYVGPMHGLMCLGLADDQALSASELVRTAQSQVAEAGGPGN